MARPRPDQPAADLTGGDRGDRGEAGANVLLVTAGGVPPWARAIARRTANPGALAADDSARAALDDAECVVVDAEGADPVAVARRVHALDPSMQIVVVVPSERRRALDRAILFAPGVGELWLASSAEVAGALTERAAGVTHQRRRFERTRARLERERLAESPQRTARALISDAYLAGLLQVLPDAIFSLDAAGRILSANPGASALLGRDGRQLVGCLLADILAPESAESVRRLVHAAAEREARAEVHFLRADGEGGIAELTIIPVVAGTTRVWAALLHDVTGRERARTQLEQQAAALEQQVEESQMLTEELESTNAELQHALRAAEQARTLAEAARTEAEDAARSKSEFLSTMSHEIRTPINAIIGYAQLMEMGIPGPLTSNQREQLERITTSGRHLLGLINDVLDLAKVESGRLTVARVPGVASLAADAALDLIRPQAAAKGVTLGAACEGTRAATYLGDEQRVQQILVNLLSNAVKFTPPRGRVMMRCGATEQPPSAVKAAEADSWVFIEVEDTGIGIDSDTLSKLFEPFVQAETGYTRMHGGTGLGLSISRRLARLMGGELTVESRPRKGSRFTLWLPSASTLAHAAEPVAESVPALPYPEVSARKISRAANGETSFSDAGRALLERMNDVVERFAAALQADPVTAASAGRVTTPELEDHLRTWLTDAAQTLITLQAHVEPTQLIRDGAEIRRVISARHGAQRYQLGWTEKELMREFQVLRDAIAEALSSRALSGLGAAEARSVLDGLIQQAEQISLHSLRNAARTALPDSATLPAANT